MSSADAERQRTYARNYRRRQSARRFAAERSKLERCPRKAGSYPCGGLLEIGVTRDGRTVTRCLKCERREAGICQDCPRPVYGQVRKALRCAECKRRKIRDDKRVFSARHVDELRQAWRDYARAWRAKHPGYAAAVARRWRQRHPDRAAAVRDRWVRKNPERIKLLRRRWYRTHKAKRRRAVKAAA